jgi:hypothetical protein
MTIFADTEMGLVASLLGLWGDMVQDACFINLNNGRSIRMQNCFLRSKAFLTSLIFRSCFQQKRRFKSKRPLKLLLCVDYLLINPMAWLWLFLQRCKKNRPIKQPIAPKAITLGSGTTFCTGPSTETTFGFTLPKVSAETKAPPSGATKLEALGNETGALA